MKILAITTFSIDGYELYGKKMISSWLKHWPNDIELKVYTEDYVLDERDIRLTDIDINYACPNLQIFKDNSKRLIDPNNKKSKNRIDKAIRWSHKVYAISDALDSDCDYLIYLDGDTYTKDKIDIDLAKRLVNDHLLAVHFEKLNGYLHFETGLMIFNMKHPQLILLKDNLQAGYDNLSIYKERKPWDGFWFAHLYKKFNLDVVDLTYGKHSGVFSNPLIKGKIVHEVGKDKWKNKKVAYNKYSGRTL